MTSPEKRNANRLNAQRSTGPRTSRGKRASASNARRHGLSVALRPEHMGPARARIASLLAQDSLGASLVLDLTDKIFEYERNLAHQRDYFMRVYVQRTNEPEAVERRMLEQTPELDMLKDLMDHQRYFVGRVNLRDLAFVSRQTMRFRSSWLRRHEREVRFERAAAHRYMRRSTNQLIKALRRL